MKSFNQFLSENSTFKRQRDNAAEREADAHVRAARTWQVTPQHKQPRINAVEKHEFLKKRRDIAAEKLRSRPAAVRGADAMRRRINAVEKRGFLKKQRDNAAEKLRSRPPTVRAPRRG